MSGSSLLEVVRQTELIEAVRRCTPESTRGSGNRDGDTAAALFCGDCCGGARGRDLWAVIVLHDITALRKLERIRRDFVATYRMSSARR